MRYYGLATRDGSNNIVGFTNLRRIEGLITPKPVGDYHWLEGDSTPFPEAYLDGNNWKVREDAAARAANDTEVAARDTRRGELRKITQLRDAIDANFTVEQATVLKKVFREILEEIMDGK